MPLSFSCLECGKGYKAPDHMAGRTVNCKKCGSPITVPILDPIEPAEDQSPEDEQQPEPSAYALEVPDSPPAPEPPVPPPVKRRIKPKQVDLASLPPLTTNDPPFWRRHLHWLLALALVPLVVSLLSKSEDSSLAQRFDESLRHVTEEERELIINRMKNVDSIDELFSLLPGQRLHGAFLRRSSNGHWLMALVAAMIFMAFFMFLASDGAAEPAHVLAVGIFTATIGIGFLLFVQFLASFTDGRMMFGRGVVVILFYLLKFIAFSYSAALNPDNGFFASFVGFTLGVGLCEEVVKTIPLFWHRSTESGRTWRGMFIWGLASGAGFGIAEGIMYSSRYYNGLLGPGIYLVRFISCVALHSIWTGSVAILLYQMRDRFDGLSVWYEWIMPTIFVVAVPAILHGLYDTCLKKEMNGFALLVAFASFGYLAFLFSRLQAGDDRAATKAMLREYQRRKSALS